MLTPLASPYIRLGRWGARHRVGVRPTDPQIKTVTLQKGLRGLRGLGVCARSCSGVNNRWARSRTQSKGLRVEADGLPVGSYHYGNYLGEDNNRLPVTLKDSDRLV